MSVCASGLASSRFTIASTLLARLDEVHDVLDVGVGRAEARALDVRGVALHAVGERAHVARERRRDEMRAAPGGHEREDRLEVLAEAEVEHAIGLVEHDGAELRRVDARRA